ncbi:MAG: hypothetical protein ACR2RA_02615 [Geminicoccaceae bacterium]
MRSGLLLLAALAGAGVIGYQEITHRAERETWRAESTRLAGRLESAKRLADERAQALAAAQNQDRRAETAGTELNELEARILDAAAELTMLESDRAVARARAESTVGDLKKQVRALTTIELDLAVLDKRRRHLERHVETVEERLHQAEAGAAERQKRSEALDRDIAGLAIRRETVQARLESAERTLAETALAVLAKESTEERIMPSPELRPLRDDPKDVADTQPLLEAEKAEETDRSRGLYQFGSLSAAPDAVIGGQGGLPPSSQDETADTASWAEDQYLMGLQLLSSAEQSSGTRALSDAVLAFKAVLGEWPKERDPMRWAIARSDLGYALALLGRRQSDTAVLEQAAAACRDALGELGRSETPMLWAAAQHHLGVSLGGLADMRDDPDLRQASIEALEQAIAGFKGAGANADAKKAENRLREAYARLPAAPTGPVEETE